MNHPDTLHHCIWKDLYKQLVQVLTGTRGTRLLVSLGVDHVVRMVSQSPLTYSFASAVTEWPSRLAQGS